VNGNKSDTIVKSLHDLLVQEYHVQTRIKVNPLTASVAVTATRVLIDNPRRLSVVIVNTGANPVYIAPDNQVSTSRGIYLAAGGGSMALKWTDDFESVSSERWAIGSGGVSTLYIEENVLV